jgi:DNA-binding response OmpR family regulator
VVLMAFDTTFDLLLVTPVESDSRDLASILAHSRWALHWVRTRQEGLEFVRHTPFMAVVCDRNLSEGSWKDFASGLRVLPEPPLLFVACSNPGGLWSDVVHAGGFDVVMKPFEREEITWALTVAWSHWSDRVTWGKAKSNGRPVAGF